MLELLASGRTADVYIVGDGRVLRRYRGGFSTEHEADAMQYLGKLGYPVPTVYEAAGTDMVMERVDGPTLVEAMVAGAVSVDDGSRILADLHTSLHALPARGSGAGDSVLHLDLHAENVIMSPRGPIVIDWQNATEGPADFDIAVSAMIMGEVAVDPDRGLTELAEVALAAFLKYAGMPRPEMIEQAFEMRSGNPSLSSEERGRLRLAASKIQL